MAFKKAVEKALPGAYRKGVKALENTDRVHISCENPRMVIGSVNIDKTLKRSHPNDSRWDYGIGIRGQKRTEQVIWVEVHPASSSHIEEMLKKRQWLKAWLERSAPELSKLTARQDGYIWLASGKVGIQRSSPQARRLARQGITFPREHLRL
jgi:hypothetical protein